MRKFVAHPTTEVKAFTNPWGMTDEDYEDSGDRYVELDSKKVPDSDGFIPDPRWCLPYELDEKQRSIVDDIVERFCTSVPVSGDWDTELEEGRRMIAEELGIDERYVNYIMIDYLGFDPEEIEDSWYFD